jgi:hypothetical protein
MISKIAVVTGGNKGKIINLYNFIHQIWIILKIFVLGIGFAIVKALAQKFDGLIYLTGRWEFLITINSIKIQHFWTVYNLKLEMKT